MAFLVKDRVKETSSTTGTGTLTLAGAVAGFQAFSVIGDANTTHYTLLDANGTGWEVGIGTYTLSGTTLARTTILASSNSGSAITLSAGTHSVFCGFPASVSGQLMTATNIVTGTDAATTMVANATYVVAMSGWATADRIYTCPASPAIGDRVSIVIQSGNASFELIVKGNTSQTINGGSSASEWSRLLITGECVTLRYVASNTWIVEYDGRIPMVGGMRLSTSATGEVAATFAFPTVKSGVWTVETNVGSVCTAGSDKILARRACAATIAVSAYSNSYITTANYFDVAVEINGTGSQMLYVNCFAGANANMALSGTRSYQMAVDDYFRFQWRSLEGGRGLYGSATAADAVTTFSLTEIL